MMLAQQAKAAGMVDRIATLDEVLGSEAVDRKPGVRAELAWRRARAAQPPSRLQSPQ